MNTLEKYTIMILNTLMIIKTNMRKHEINEITRIY